MKSLKYASLLLACTTLLVACGSTEKQKVSKIDVQQSSSKKTEKKKDKPAETTEQSSETSTEQSSQEAPAETTQPSEQPAEVKTGISQNVEAIRVLTASYHHFTHATNKLYDEQVAKFAQFNITLDPSVKGPYGLYDYESGQPSDVVIAGVSGDSSIVPFEGGYEIRVKSKVGTSPVVDSVNYTGREIQSQLQSAEYAGQEKEVIYRLQVAPDDLSATLVRVSDNWW